MNCPQDPPAPPRSNLRRLAWVTWLTAVVATSIGHGANVGSSGPPAPPPPPPPSCAPGTLHPTVVGDPQTGYAGAPLGRPLVLAFVCTNTLNGQPMPAGSRLDVQWSVASGGGTINGATQFLSPAASTSNAEVHWSLGAGVLGTQTATATVAGQAFAFTATALPPTTGGTCTSQVSTTGTNFEDSRTIVGSQTWTLAGSPYRGRLVWVEGTLNIEPGVMVCVNDSLYVSSSGSLIARGTAALPIRLVGHPQNGVTLTLMNAYSAAPRQGPPSELLHVHGESMADLSVARHPVLVEDSTFVAAPTNGGCPGVTFVDDTPSRPVVPHVVRRTVFEGYGRTNSAACVAAVTLSMAQTAVNGPAVFQARVLRSANVGVQITGAANAWAVSNCSISGSGSHGLQVDTATGPITGCSFSGNGGNGIHNSTPAAFSVTASGNWWGQPAGPLGPGGDGVSVGVDFSSPLASPPALGY